MSSGIADGGMSATWRQTTRRILPRLASLSREIRPTFHLESAADIFEADLRGLGIEALLWDVDGTLMAHHANRIDPRIAEPVGRLLDAPGLRHAIVSNCQENRFAELGHMIPTVPVLLGYETRVGPAFRVRLGPDETWRGPGADRAQDVPGELRPIRKPSQRLVLAALDELGFGDRPEAALMVGDQYFTDIASANLAGVRSVKVPTLDRASFPTPVRVAQRLEAIFFRLAYGKHRIGLDAP